MSKTGRGFGATSGLWVSAPFVPGSGRERRCHGGVSWWVGGPAPLGASQTLPRVHFPLHLRHLTLTPARTPNSGLPDLSPRPPGTCPTRQSHRGVGEQGRDVGAAGWGGEARGGPGPAGGRLLGVRVTRISIQGRCSLWCWWPPCGVAHSRC